MNMHCSDRKKIKAEVWKYGCILYRLQQIDLSKFEKGNIIVKNSQQKRILANGKERIYTYHYENIDVFGKGQFHLPVRGDKRHNPDDPKWKIRDGILYRNQTERKIEDTIFFLENAICELNSYKKSTEEPETLDKIMISVKKAMENKDVYEKIKKEKEKKFKSYGYNPLYEINGLIVTDLGEEVRSKNECLFANKLREMGVPYLYEMSIGGGVLPDFTIFVDDKVFFVELFGKMNDENYRENQKNKIAKYEEMGIFKGKQLVLIDTTMGFSMPVIENLIYEIIEKGPPEEIVLGFNRRKFDAIEAGKKLFCDEDEDCLQNKAGKHRNTSSF